jgi:hypothetical protein
VHEILMIGAKAGLLGAHYERERAAALDELAHGSRMMGLLGENPVAPGGSREIAIRPRNRASFLGIRPIDAPASSAAGIRRSSPPCFISNSQWPQCIVVPT